MRTYDYPLPSMPLILRRCLIVFGHMISLLAGLSVAIYSPSNRWGLITVLLGCAMVALYSTLPTPAPTGNPRLLRIEMAGTAVFVLFGGGSLISLLLAWLT